MIPQLNVNTNFLTSTTRISHIWVVLPIIYWWRNNNGIKSFSETYFNVYEVGMP